MNAAAENEYMTDVSNRKRQPRGVPIGGEFAANEHDEAGGSLSAMIEKDNVLSIDAEHFDAVQKIVGEKDSLVTRQDAEELLAAESGTRPRMYGLIQREDNGQYEIVSLKSQYDLDRHETVAQWVSGTTVADLVSPAGRPTADEIEHNRATYGERRIAVSVISWEYDREDFAKLREPRDEDFQATLDTISADISNDSFPNGENSWKSVVGANAPRTAKNKQKYAEHLARVAGNDPTYRAKHVHYAKINAELGSYARAYEQGVAVHPAAERYFEEVWNNPNDSHGEAGIRREQEHLKALRAGLENGTVKPSAIIGTGTRDPRAGAIAWLDRRDREQAEALRTRGRSQSVLASNADGRVRRALAGE